MLIFVSYTLRDGVLSKESLNSFRSGLSSYVDTYVDILDNKALDPQAYVFAMLQKADVLLVCETRGFYMSEWTQLELAVAKQRNIPIFRVTAEQLCRKGSAYFEVIP